MNMDSVEFCLGWKRKQNSNYNPNITHATVFIWLGLKEMGDCSIFSLKTIADPSLIYFNQMIVIASFSQPLLIVKNFLNGTLHCQSQFPI